MKAQYRKKPGKTVVAVQLDLDTEGFTYQKWGRTQVCKPGDWLVNNDGDVYTVDQQTFSETYEKVGPGLYAKTGTVWAVAAEEPGVVVTKEGLTEYEAGDYLVSNHEAGQDSYAISRAKFLSAYEPVET